MQTVNICNIGLIEYQESWALQRDLVELKSQGSVRDVLLLNEHHPVYTLGKNSNMNHLLSNRKELFEKGIDAYEIERGGDVTFHGPGQIVGYPILDLSNYYLDLHRYLRDLEEIIIRTLADFNVNGTRDDKYTGVWVGSDKIAAIGVKVNRWITMHGFALNVNTDLTYFDRIIPCGIFHKGVTSLEQILGKHIEMNLITKSLQFHFCEVFGVQANEISKTQLVELVQKGLKDKTECLQLENQ